MKLWLVRANVMVEAENQSAAENQVENAIERNDWYHESVNVDAVCATCFLEEEDCECEDENQKIQTEREG